MKDFSALSASLRISHSYIFIVLCLILLIATGTTRAQSTEPGLYRKALAEALPLPKSAKADEVETVLQLIKTGSLEMAAGEITAHIKKSYPAVEPDRPIRLLPYVIQNRVTTGNDYERMLRIMRPLLKFMWLENRVLPVLFKSDVPVIGVSYPNAVMISTRALDILNDAEIEAITAHEVCHLIGQAVFEQAVEKHDNRTLRTLELFYDAGAASIITSEGGDPRNLIKGLYKMIDVLKAVTGDDDSKGDHPTMNQRQRLNNSLIESFQPPVARATK